MPSKTARGVAIAILLPTMLVIGYLLGGFVAMVVLIVGGAAWWAVGTYAIVGLLAALACVWLWKHRSPWAE